MDKDYQTVSTEKEKELIRNGVAPVGYRFVDNRYTYLFHSSSDLDAVLAGYGAGKTITIPPPESKPEKNVEHKSSTLPMKTGKQAP